ncbi:MAG: class I SAM-dependent rRNA methyltransferase [Thermoguttaceae bacterium]
MAQVVLKPRKARPFYGRHPWVLDSAVERVEGAPADGDIVDLVSDKGKFVARGVFNSRSRIRVRLYTWRSTEALDEAFWRRRLEAAVRLRSVLGYADPQGAARLVFSEGDGLSGLIVDRYADYLVIQVTSLGMVTRLPAIMENLAELVKPQGILVRTDRSVSKAEGLDPVDRFAWGKAPDGPVLITDQGLRYHVDLAEGQKTGFYLDQRENRREAARYMRDRKVLDVFCYSGGFGLAAAALGGAQEVLGIDSSRKAIELAKTNAELNGLTNVGFEAADSFEWLEARVSAGQRYGGVVLDPPKFAGSRRGIDEALRAYHWLNRLGVELLEPGGILVTCSCSGHVTRDDFLDMLLGVAQQTGRDLQLLQVRGPSPDHPVMVTCPESEYLKCVICRVV